jgi:putative transposase
MKEEKTFYHRNLPHIHIEYGVFFVTFRLANSLPAEVIERLKHERTLAEKRLENIKDFTRLKEERVIERKRYFIHFDEYLDRENKRPR